MDKKQNFYSRQGSSKALISEPRKSSDIFLNKPRNARRRENTNLSNSKSDPQRGSKPAKVRTNVDKRPRPRGGNNSVSLNLSSSGTGLALNNVDIEEGPCDVELNSVYTPGSKKQNLNHLLNFHYSPREHDTSNGLSVFCRYGNRSYTKKHKYNKEQFLQANFQFVIKSDAEKLIDRSSPDLLIDWSLIEQINIQTTEEPQCPICLYPPIAPKLTRCGHAYCWPCILHYLALTDKTWRKCPICYEAIHIGDLKSTAIVQQMDFKVGNLVTLQLMRRKKGSIFIEKLEVEEYCNGKIPHLMAEENKKKFSKFLLANKKEVLSIIERERMELTTDNDEECPEFVFIQQALDLLKEREDAVMKGVQKIEHGDKITAILDVNKINIKADMIKKNDNKIEEKEPSNESSAQNEITNTNLGAVQKDNGKYYYFYQSVDGQNIFLHPLNVKMLQAMYGSLERGPKIIETKILQKESQSMDEDHRKKFTCLGHLPLTCQFEIVEVQLEPPIVSEEILNIFRDDIVLRQKTRMRRAREEKKREKEINAINERQMGKIISCSANIDIKSSQQFPICGSDDGLSRSSLGDGSFSFSSDLPDPPISIPSISTNSNITTTFANILTSPKKEFWPTLDGSSPTKTTAASPKWIKSTPPLTRNSITENDPEQENGEGNILMRQNLADVLVEALQQKITTQGNNNGNGNGKQVNKKNKKAKKTLLFSTGINFNGN